MRLRGFGRDAVHGGSSEKAATRTRIGSRSRKSLSSRAKSVGDEMAARTARRIFLSTNRPKADRSRICHPQLSSRFLFTTGGYLA